MVQRPWKPRKLCSHWHGGICDCYTKVNRTATSHKNGGSACFDDRVPRRLRVETPWQNQHSAAAAAVLLFGLLLLLLLLLQQAAVYHTCFCSALQAKWLRRTWRSARAGLLRGFAE